MSWTFNPFTGTLDKTGSISTIPDENVIVDHVTGATCTTLEDYINKVGSAGIVAWSGGVTDAGSATVDIATGSALFRTANNHDSPLVFGDWAARTGVSLTDNSDNYIIAEYNAGSPQVIVSPSNTANYHDKILLATVYKEGTGTSAILHINQYIKQDINDAVAHIIQRFVQQAGFSRESGAQLSGSNLNIAITQGIFWLGLNRFLAPENTFDSSPPASDTFTYFWRDGSGGWTHSNGETEIDNTRYDDGSGTLATLAGAKNGVHWVYLETDSEVAVVYGRGAYTIKEAEAAEPPSDLPPEFGANHGILVGKIIVKNGDTTLTSVESAFTTTFTGTGISSHLDLTDIGVNTHAQIDTHIADTANPHSTSLVNLTDTTISSPLTNQLLQYNGSVWTNATVDSIPGIGSSTDNALVRWNGTSGDAIQDSGWTLDDSNDLTMAGDVIITTPNSRSIGGSPNNYLRSVATNRIYFDDPSSTLSTTTILASTTQVSAPNLELPGNVPAAGKVLGYKSGTNPYVLEWVDGSGNVSAAANITDNAIVRGDGGVKDVQNTGWVIDDNDNMAFGITPTTYNIDIEDTTVANIRLGDATNKLQVQGGTSTSITTTTATDLIIGYNSTQKLRLTSSALQLSTGITSDVDASYDIGTLAKSINEIYARTFRITDGAGSNLILDVGTLSASYTLAFPSSAPTTIGDTLQWDGANYVWDQPNISGFTSSAVLFGSPTGGITEDPNAFYFDSSSNQLAIDADGQAVARLNLVNSTNVGFVQNSTTLLSVGTSNSAHDVQLAPNNTTAFRCKHSTTTNESYFQLNMINNDIINIKSISGNGGANIVANDNLDMDVNNILLKNTGQIILNQDYSSTNYFSTRTGTGGFAGLHTTEYRTNAYHEWDITGSSFGGYTFYFGRSDIFQSFDIINQAATNLFRLRANGNCAINDPTSVQLAQLSVRQASTTAAIPVLRLDQQDISEGCIDFIASARGAISSSTSSVQSVRVELNGVIYRLALYADA